MVAVIAQSLSSCSHHELTWALCQLELAETNDIQAVDGPDAKTPFCRACARRLEGESAVATGSDVFS